MKQYKNRNDLWAALQKVCDDLQPEEIENLTQSMDDRLFRVVQANGRHIKM